MTTQSLASRIKHWTKTYSFCNTVEVKNRPDQVRIEFEARTTKTRASSIVTRIRLITREVIGETAEYSVDKELCSEAPNDRASLATWKVFVAITKRKVPHAA